MQTLATNFTATRSLISRLLAFFTFRGSSAKRRPPLAAAHHQHGSHSDEPFCDGYNEAFVVQYWTGYNPRH